MFTLFAGTHIPAQEPDPSDPNFLILAPGTEQSLRTSLLPHRDDQDKQVELFWITPDGDGPFPAILYIHGHQSGEDKPGARQYVDRGYLQPAVDAGMIAAAVSQPGYGKSDGPPDYCGPFTQAAVATALAFLREQPNVRQDRVLLYGYSRGAMVAAMVATKDTELAGVILGAGSYDLGARYELFGDNRLDRDMKANVEQEAGSSEEAFAARSALLAEEPILVPSLILHGEDDKNCPVEQARELAEQLEAAGTKHRFLLFPKTGHGISSQQSAEHEKKFWAETVLSEKKN